MHIKHLIVILLVLLAGSLISQNSEKANELYLEALDAYLDSNYTQSYEKFLLAAETESSMDSIDYDFTGDCHLYAAQAIAEIKEYNTSILELKNALSLYRESENTINKKSALKWLAYVYQKLQYENQKLDYTDEERTGKLVLFSVDSILKQSNDTMWVIISGGSNDSIDHDEEGTLYSIYDPENPERGMKEIGIGHMDLSVENASLCHIVLNYPNDTSLWVRKGDMVEFYCYLPYYDHNLIFDKIARYNINFTDRNGWSYYDQMELLYNLDELLQKDILDVMVYDAYQTYEDLNGRENKDSLWIMTIDYGRFAGINMIEAIGITNKSDIRAYLNYITSYAGEYFGQKYNFIERYAYWVLTSTPLGEFDKEMFSKIKKLNGRDFDDYVYENTYYIQDTMLDLVNTDINDFIIEKEYEKAIELNDKALKISNILEKDNYLSIFMVNQGVILSNQDKNKEAIEIFNKAIEIDSTNLNAYYFRANAYGLEGDYYHSVADYNRITDSLPDFALAHGNKGWHLLLDGKIFDALESCKKAYDLDSSQLSYAINLGHAYLLLGDTSHANRYYRKAMDNLTSVAQYKSGPVEDFDTLLVKGWQAHLVKQARDYVQKLYEEDYSYYLQADSLGDLSIELKDSAKYKEAAKMMIKAYETELSSKNPRDYWLYWQSGWVGYMYQQFNVYDTADIYYKIGLHYAKDILKDDGKTANMYDLLSWNSDHWGKKTDYMTYTEKSEAYERKFQDAGKRRKLYFIGVANNAYQDMEYSFAENDADSLASVFTANPSGYYDTVSVDIIKTNELTFERLESSFREVITESKPDDIFVFYLSGIGSLDTNKFNLNLRHADSINKRVSVETNTIKSWLSSIQARNQWLVLDIFAPTFIDEFVGNYAISRGALAGSNLNLSILSLSGHRIEDDTIQHGLLSNSLINILEDKDHSSLSIKDINAELFSINKESIFTWNTYHTGNDFTLMVRDSSQLAAKREIAHRGKSRSVGSISLEFDDDGSAFVGESTNYALIFATDKYDDWDDLVNPVFDATALANTLKDFYGFEVELLTNNTRMDVLTKIREYQKKKYNKNDQLFIFFAGHGSFDEISGEGYIVCKDSKKDDEIKASYIPYSYLRENINNIRGCHHILLTLDVCFGGTFDKKVSRFSRGNSDYDQISKEAFINRAMQFKSRLFITSGSKEYVSDGEPGKHSPFAYRILDVLRSQGMSNGYVTFNILVQSVERLQTTPRYGDFGDNEPGSEFIFSLEMEVPKRAFKIREVK